MTPQNVTVGAGGAVIALSEVDDEYEEMLLKATSVLGALGHVKSPGQSGPPGSEPTSSTMRSPTTSPPTLPKEGKEGLRLGDPTSRAEALPGLERTGGTAAALGGNGRGPVAVGLSSAEGIDVTEEQRRLQ